ncbi:MAG: SPFH domain-containing protein, partial [Sphaerochaetaceae bacterium]|nr:SPFH domain-containing protein [Sphaerochaetaceae bacterium]
NMIDFPIPVKTAYLVIAGVLILALNGLFFWANAGTAYAVQYPWGGDKMIKTQGFKTKFWGRTIPLSYEISIKDIISRANEEGDRPEIPESKDGIYNRQAQRWEFSDAIKADIATAVVVGVDTDNEEVFLNMADRNRSESKLIYGRVLPNIDAALKNTCKLMDAQEYISGKASDFDRYFRDQLENGMYLVEEYIQEEELPEIIGDTATVRTIQSTSQTSKQTKYRIKRDDQGNIMRDNKSNTLKQYGIRIYQAQVTGIDWEESFDARLQLQKEQVAQTQLEKQEAEKEFYRAKKEIAKGESEKAAERARLEKEQIKLTIAAETEAKVAEQNLIAEKKKYEVAKYTKLTEKELADAKAYTNQKLVSAGLTPQERAEWEYKTAVGVAKELKELKLPSTYIEGQGGSKGGNLLESLIGAELAKGMLNQKQ